VGILGISYKGDIKVPRVSRSAQIGRLLADHGLAVAIHDPYFDEAEVNQLFGLERFAFPSEVERFEGLLLGADHREYTTVHWNEVIHRMAGCRLILDGCGAWGNIDFEHHGIAYFQPGTQNWLQVPDPKETGRKA
jgi:UDP-N-acetyl-D-mannosaminuronate dehydrogenase